MLENNLFRANKVLTDYEYSSMPSRLVIDVNLAEMFIHSFNENFYKLGLNDSIKEINPREHQMNLYVLTPVDMLEFLEAYDKLDKDKKEKFILSIKNKRPGAWLSRNYIPLENSKSLSETKIDAIKHCHER